MFHYCFATLTTPSNVRILLLISISDIFNQVVCFFVKSLHAFRTWQLFLVGFLCRPRIFTVLYLALCAYAVFIVQESKKPVYSGRNRLHTLNKI